MVGEIIADHVGKMKLEFTHELGMSVLIHLFDTLYVAKATTNFFSLQKLRKANYRLVRPKFLGTQWIMNKKEKIIRSLTEDENGRAIATCKFLLPPSTPSPLLPFPSSIPVGQTGGNMPRWLPGWVPTLGFEDGIFPTEGIDQSWGALVEEGSGELNWVGMPI